MKHLSMIGFAFSLASIFSTQAFAECVCVKEWIWGGCAQHECYSELSNGGGGGQSYENINLRNSCSRPIQAAIHFKDLNGNWTTNGWYNIAPGQQASVANTKNSIYYVYAESIEHQNFRLEWEGNDGRWPIHGSSQSYAFTKSRFNSNQWGTHTHNFLCDGMTKFHAVAVAWNGNGAWSARAANTEAQARQQALASCQNCSIAGAINPSSFACIALAGSNNHLFFRAAFNIGTAKSGAMQSCSVENQNCNIVYEYCNN